MSYLERIEACNRHDLTQYIPFLVGTRAVGWVKTSVTPLFRKTPDVFDVSNTAVSFIKSLATPESRSVALAEIAREWVSNGTIRELRNEIYPVRDTWVGPDHFQLDRGLTPLFGVRAYGVHFNGFVETSDGYLMWIGKRSADRHIEPNKFDNMVAGGQPAGLSLMENLIKECEEEAGLPAALAARSSPVGTISYCFENDAGLKPDTLFCYDLRIPGDFTPINQDGEIADFRLMPLSEALKLIREGDSFKFNVALVILDFAIRRGVLSPDEEPEYEAIMLGLRQGLRGTEQNGSHSMAIS